MGKDDLRAMVVQPVLIGGLIVIAFLVLAIGAPWLLTLLAVAGGALLGAWVLGVAVLLVLGIVGKGPFHD